LLPEGGLFGHGRFSTVFPKGTDVRLLQIDPATASPEQRVFQRSPGETEPRTPVRGLALPLTNVRGSEKPSFSVAAHAIFHTPWPMGGMVSDLQIEDKPGRKASTRRPERISADGEVIRAENSVCIPRSSAAQFSWAGS
jgi:hypothetical protein